MKPARPCVAVAASGGRDSTALLHSTLRAAAPLGVQVVALHVHHGLQPQADAWLAQVRGQARRWGAAFMAQRLAGRPAPGESVEAWARRERYAALAEMARQAGCGLVLLAHHRRDQAETWLLQALRGGGPAGLAAMPAAAKRQGLVWARPWLHQPREAIEAYLRRHRLRFVDDDSNADPRYARNRLRLQVWPALQTAFPGAETTLADAARQAAHAAALAAELAALDLPALRDEGHALCVPPWQALSPARRRNALQAWLAETLDAGVPHSLLRRLVDELPGRARGRWPAPGGELRLYRGRLAWHQAQAAPTAAPNAVDLQGAAATDIQEAAAISGPLKGEIDRQLEGEIDLGGAGPVGVGGWRGSLEVVPCDRGGVPAERLRRLRFGPRRGGERFRLSPRGLPRSLKKQFQAAGVPAWQREGPLLWLPDGRLLFVPGLGIDAGLQAPPGQPQWQLRWCPQPEGLPGPRQAEG